MKKFLVLDPKESFSVIYRFDDSCEADIFYDGQIYYKEDCAFFRQFDAVIAVNVGNPLNLYVLAKCKGMCPVVVMSDGVYEWMNAHANPKTRRLGVTLYDPMVCDLFLYVGPKNTYLEYINPNVTFRSFLPARMNISQKPPNKPRIKAGKMESSVLITTANTAYFDMCERDRLLKLLLKVVECSNDVFDVVDFRIFDEYLSDEIGKVIGEFKNIKTGEFADVVRNYSSVISTVSSISLEVMASGIPLAHLDVRDAPMFVQAGWRITDSVDINKTLECMKSGNQERLKFQYSQVSNVMRPDVVSLEPNNFISAPETMESLEWKKNFFASQVLSSPWNINFKIFLKKLFKYMKIRKG